MGAKRSKRAKPIGASSESGATRKARNRGRKGGLERDRQGAAPLDPQTESARLAALRNYGILDTPPEEAFDRITRLASRILGTPITLISLVGHDRQWFKSRVGLDVDATPRDVAFCDHTIRTPDVMVVEDARNDDRFRENPLVTGDPHIRFYAGAPLITPENHRIGTLCAVDYEPRRFSEDDVEALTDLSRMVVDELELRRSERAARLAEDTLREAIYALPDGFVLYDAEDRLVICNERYRELYAESAEAFVPGVKFEDAIRYGLEQGQYPDAIGCEEEWIAERMRTHRNPSAPVEQRLPDGRWIRVLERRTDDGGTVGFRTDITDLKEREEALDRLATQDPLTGLPNRSKFQERLADALADAKRTGQKVGVMLLDLDRFKHVNDAHGHGTGDELLRQVAERLCMASRRTDTVSRLGGDEFAIVAAHINHVRDLTILADRIIEDIGDEFTIDGKEILTGTSIGLTIAPDDPSDIEGLVRNADLALYRAKSVGRGCWRLYDEALQEETQLRRTIERDLRVAIDNGDLHMHYQPQINVTTGATTGAEALLRWTHPERGAISPGEFIAIAEMSQLIVPISEWVLRTVCHQIRAWKAEGLPEIVTAVNVSPIEFHQHDFIDRLSTVITDERIKPNLLEIEITEHSAMADRIDTRRIFNAMKELGVRVAIDDFGTGYSSLSRLKDVHFNRLKIDRSFVDGVTDRWDDAAICASVIRLGQSLNVEVIAEGVETEAQLEALLELGCTEMQGYYFAKAMPADEFASFLTANAAPPAHRSAGQST